MKKIKSIIILLLVVILCTACQSTSDRKQTEDTNTILDPSSLVTISLWHYYSGAQQEAFNGLVEEFNQTKGKEIGVFVKASNHGNVTELAESVQAAVDGKVGASEMPNIFAAYTDTAYEIDKKGVLADLSQYMTTKEQEEYIDSYIEEGRFSKDNSLKIWPIAKSTEIFAINKTDWDKFAAATQSKLSECKTIEGVTNIAKKYYEWTDSLTPEPNDGKAFYGRDSMSNYFVIGSKQLGEDIVAVDKDKATVNFTRENAEKLWNNYYVPYIKGYFAASGRFRSDDVKTGSIIAFTGSSSGATFLPKEVIVNDAQSYKIDMKVMEAPKFKDGKDYAVQQGAGMVVTAADEKQVYASVQFLKWFTDSKRNKEFSIDSGYLPVKKEANDVEEIGEFTKNHEKIVMDVVERAIQTVNNNKLYTMEVFEHANDVRKVLDYSLADKADQDRAVVIQNLQSGMTLPQAVALFENEENFNSWYQDVSMQLEQLVQ
ncbi:MAG: extracellular solute-binding protein [Lachnospiraceae bacterium]